MGEPAFPDRALAVFGSSVHATAEDVRSALEKAGRDDPEIAHSAECAFVRHVLTAIADGHPNPARLAREVLVVLNADYPRWCA